MLTFPYIEFADAPAEGAPVAGDYPTDIAESENGIEQRRGRSVYPRHTLAIRYERDMNAATRLNTLWDFYRQPRGPLLPFVYFDFDNARVWTRARVGLGVTAQTVFTLPSRDAASVTMYVNGVAATGTFLARGGSNGRDEFTFATDPAENAVIEMTFTGRRAFEMRHANAKLTYKLFSGLLYETGLDLTEVKGES